LDNRGNNNSLVEEVVVDILLDHKLLVVEHSCHFAARLAGGETMRCRRTTCLFGAEKKRAKLLFYKIACPTMRYNNIFASDKNVMLIASKL
jgi:hypothetical protein